MTRSTEALKLNGGRFEVRKTTVDEYLKYLEEKGITLPSFQRGKVWSANDMMALATTMKNGEPMPTIVVAEVEGRFYLLDGQQRTNSFNILKKKFEEKMPTTAKVLGGYEVALMEVAFDTMHDANELYNRLNAKSGLTVGQKTKGTVHQTFKPLYDYIQTHPIIKDCYTKVTKAKFGEDDTMEATVEKTEDITNALTVATVMPSFWSTQTSALAKHLSSEWTHQQLIETYYQDVDVRLEVVAEVIKLRSDIASRIKSNKAVFTICYLLSKDFEASVISQALRKVFDGEKVVSMKRDLIVEEKGAKSKVRKDAVELFGSGSSNDASTSRYKEAFIRQLCVEQKAEVKGRRSMSLTDEEKAMLMTGE